MRKATSRRPRPGKGEEIARASKKLKQARFFLAQLEKASKEPGNGRQEVESYYSACLTAVQSAYYILSCLKTFKKIEDGWRKTLAGSELVRFKNMKTRRDDDVHFGESDATAHQKFVNEDRLRSRSTIVTPMFGSEITMEHENADGTRVRGSVFRVALGLYIEQEGQYIEVTTASKEFIDRMDSLMEAVEASASGSAQ